MKVQLLILSGILALFVGQALNLTFKQEQLRHPRVRAAEQEKAAAVRDLFQRQAVPFPPKEIFLRAFKQEALLELWARSGPAQPFVLIKTYPICSGSGQAGPKRRQGDGQVPEGFYFIDRFNPQSQFHLSLGVNYPNDSDRVLGAKGKLGGEIFIHGNCVTIGCIPITDEQIQELYLIAIEARSGGQARIPVHIFPRRLDDPFLAELIRKNQNQPALVAFWENLKEGYDWFEQSRRVPQVRVDQKGRYRFSPGT